MGCYINTNLELEKDKELLLGTCSEDELWSRLVNEIKDVEPLPLATKIKDLDDLKEKLSKGQFDAERYLLLHLIPKFTNVLEKYPGTGKKGIGLNMAGVHKVVHDRLCHTYLIAWCTFSSSPKLAIIFYTDEEDRVQAFIPMWGNTINPNTGKAIGWDVGYDFDQSLWAQSYREDFEYVCKELYGEVDDEYEDLIYDIVHSGILEPNFSAGDAEFGAYTRFAW